MSQSASTAHLKTPLAAHAGDLPMPISTLCAVPVGQRWAIILAAGRGTRLSNLTRNAAGDSVPKQFCSLDGHATLLEVTCARALQVVDSERVSAVVATDHRDYWEPVLQDLAPDNIVAQPYDRGTAIGILLAALPIAARDPDATVLILPSDHHVADERRLAATLGETLDDIRHHDCGVALLGVAPDEPDPELGYIVPQSADHPRVHGVHRFVEKPSAREATSLMNSGALWNSFIVICRISSLVALLNHRHPNVVQALQAIDLRNMVALDAVLRDLPTVDFSRDVATGQEHRLAVVAAPHCGWNDLGTPRRLAKTLARDRRHGPTDIPAAVAGERWINLADRLTQTDDNLRMTA